MWLHSCPKLPVIPSGAGNSLCFPRFGSSGPWFDSTISSPLFLIFTALNLSLFHQLLDSHIHWLDRPQSQPLPISIGEVDLFTQHLGRWHPLVDGQPVDMFHQHVPLPIGHPRSPYVDHMGHLLVSGRWCQRDNTEQHEQVISARVIVWKLVAVAVAKEFE